MTNLPILSYVLIFLGTAGLAVPYFATTSTKDVVQLGDMKLQSTDTIWHAIPFELAIGVLGLGIILFSISLFRKA